MSLRGDGWPQKLRTGLCSGTALVLCLLLANPRAGAQVSSDEEPPPEAIELYRSGRDHYAAGRYREAITDLKAALELDPNSPNLIYNVAKVNEGLGNLDQAIDYYHRYLKVLSGSETEERERIRETIERLEGARQSLVEQSADHPRELREPVVRVQSRSAGKADLWFWVTAGTGAALLVTGTATGVAAIQKDKAATEFVVGRDGSIEDRNNLVSQANTLATATDVLLIGGAAVVTTSLLLFFLREGELEEDSEPGLQATVWTDGRSGQLTLRGAF